MASKYRNRNYGRSGYDRDEYGNRSSEGGGGRSGSGSNRGSYGSGRGGYGGDLGDFSSDRQENYFGSGRQQYGGGYTGISSERGYSSYDRDFEDDYTTGSSRRNQTDRGRTGRGRNTDRGSYYERGFGTNDYNDDRGGGGYGSENRYGRSGSRYQGERLDSMSGYYNDSDDSDYDNYDDRDDRGWVDRATDEVASWFGDEEAERRRRMDARRQGQHRGRGPKNYRRSDERIRDDINDSLTDHSYLDASEIEVEVSGGEVILKGTVDSRYAKRMAEDIVEDVSGVTHVENRIRVNQSFYGQENFYGQGSSATSETANQTTGSPQTAGKSNTDASQTGEITNATGTSGTTGKSRGKTA